MTTDEGTRSCDVRLKGKPFAMGFGFTCRPDVCLMALSELADSTETPGQDAVDKMHLTVSVDPARNTLEQLTL